MHSTLYVCHYTNIMKTLRTCTVRRQIAWKSHFLMKTSLTFSFIFITRFLFNHSILYPEGSCFVFLSFDLMEKPQVKKRAGIWCMFTWPKIICTQLGTPVKFTHTRSKKACTWKMENVLIQNFQGNATSILLPAQGYMYVACKGNPDISSDSCITVLTYRRPFTTSIILIIN